MGFMSKLSVRVLLAVMLTAGAATSDAARPQVTLDMYGANWQGDGATAGGLDAGMRGDRATLVASADEVGYPSRAEFRVDLPIDLNIEEFVTFEIGYRANAMQTTEGRVYWNGVLIGSVDAFDGQEVLKDAAFIHPTDGLNLSAGQHTISIEATDTDNQWDFFQLDAMRITAGRERDPVGGILIPYEMVTFRDGNWAGDGNTWGGLDGTADKKGDMGAIRATATPGQNARHEHPFTLETDFSGADVRLTVGYRRNNIMSQEGRVFLNGDQILTLQPFLGADKLDGADSILDEASVILSANRHSVRQGSNVIAIEADGPGARHAADFQVDALLFEAIPAMTPVLLSISDMSIHRTGEVQPMAEIALAKLLKAISELGGPPPREGEKGQLQLVLQDPHVLEDLQARFDGLEEFQIRDGYLLRVEPMGGTTFLHVVALDPRGLVFGLSDLQVRLRRDSSGGLAIEIPTSEDILEYPAFDTRGEYVNVGYNQPQITPHEWSTERWEQYIDFLILSRLNTFYFYVWVDVYGIYPGTVGAESALNKNIHEGLQHAISYARQRGMRIHFMATPSYGPADIWRQHPEAHADIEYVKYGFPAVCLSAPGAWERMKKIWAYEFEWFKEADVLQLWFYDPGGCFCHRYGCHENQASILARQVREFGDLFRELNPEAKIEFNPWPIWLWEERMGLYRDDFLKELMRLFPDGTHRELTAVCAWGSSASLPTREHQLGFGTSNFIFGSNPESGYFFLMPNLAFHQRVMRDLAKTPYRNVFGHRLEVWTRLPATFFMAQLMWNPEIPPKEAVMRWAAWQTAGGESALLLAESVLLLEKFTSEGASHEVGARMRRVAEQAMAGVPEAHLRMLSHYPTMMRGLEKLGIAADSGETAATMALADEFLRELASEPLFAPMARQGRGLFTKFVGMTRTGTNERMF